MSDTTVASANEIGTTNPAGENSDRVFDRGGRLLARRGRPRVHPEPA